MAKNTGKASNAPSAAQKAAQGGTQATVYSVADLTAAARTRFKVPPEVVQAAFKLAGKDKATLAEAGQIVKAFMERKVTR